MPRPIQPEDLYALEAVASVALHPDGEACVAAISWPDRATDENRAQLWLHDGTDRRQLTDGHRDQSPAFSPDGLRLVFLRSEPEGKPKPAVVEIGSGEVTTIDGFDDGATAVSWLDDERLLILATQRPVDQEGVDDDELARRPRTITRLDYRFNARGWTHDRKRQVFVVDVATGQQRQISDSAFDHEAAVGSPDGSTVLVVSATDDDADLTFTNHVWLMNLDGSEAVRLTPPNSRWGPVGWTSDGRPVATGSLRAGAVEFMRPHLLDPTGGSGPTVLGPHDVNAASLVGSPSPPVAVEGGLLIPGARGGAVTVDRYDLEDNTLTTVAGGEFVVGSFGATADGSRIVAAVSTPTRPAELWEFTPDGHSVLLSLNDELLQELDLVEPKTIEVQSADGTTVEGFVYRPPSTATPRPTAQQPGPALHYIHGGPMFAYGYGFFDEFQVAAAGGYTVVAGNPRGSDGYGEAWANTIAGRLGSIDWDDITALSDHLAALPEVDPARVGIGGGSYGGFMTAWAIGHTDRYAAALVERCVSNWESFAGTSDIGNFFVAQLLEATIDGENPNHGVESLRRQSPTTYAANVATPTLILHAEEDWRCPIEQAEQLFTAYRRNSVDVTFVRFPGENHEFTRAGSPRHRVERFEIVHAFYAKHLKRV